MAINGTLAVTLESNPSTGFKWLLTNISDQSVLELAQSKYKGTQGVKQTLPPPGAGGMEIWTFNALKTGRAIVLMEYSQLWEGGMKAAKTFQLTVIVK